MEPTYEELLDLRHSLRVDPSRPADKILDVVEDRLSAILTDAR